MAATAEEALALASRLAAAYAAWPAVEAVALGGSRATGLFDPASDVDLYVYAAAEPPVADRAALAAAQGARAAEVGLTAFEPGDEWRDEATGLGVDVMFRDPGFAEGALDDALVRHAPRTGWSTCLWHNLATGVPLFDRRGWLAALQARAAAPYPEALRRAVVARNLPLLASARSSFLAQLERAAARGDGVAVGHRAAAFLASAFDVLFALNRATHPGEKRLLEHARRTCPLRPPALEALVSGLLASVGRGGEGAGEVARGLAGGLTALAEDAGLWPPAAAEVAA